MSSLRIICLLCIGIAVSSAYSIADGNGKAASPAEKEEASQSLGDFLEQATGAGLLVAPGEIVPGSQLSDQGTVVGVGACGTDDPLDFSEYLKVRRYADVMPYRGAKTDDGQRKDNPGLVKAYLALGLYAEAIAVQGTPSNPSERALTEIAYLMDGYLRADREYFAQLSDCHTEAELWRGISALAFEDISGASRLERHIEAFRDLPFELRADVAALVLPTLRRNNNLLGMKLLAAFGQEDVREYSKLNIQASLLRADMMHAKSSDMALDFLSRTAPEANELLSGADGGSPLSNAQRGVVIEQAYRLLTRGADNEDIAAALTFVLKDLQQRSNYEEYIRLSVMPSLAKPDFQREIKEHLVARLLADLEQEKNLLKMSAVNMLANNLDVISGHSSEDEIILKAIAFLKSEGRVLLAATLLDAQGGSPKDAMLSASLAYQEGNFDKLSDLVQANMDDPEVIRLAALAAVLRRDADAFGQLESYLPEQVDLLIELVEEDAVAGGWLMSDENYATVRRLADPDQLARLDSVLSLKALSAGSVAITGTQGAGGRLATIGATLGQFDGRGGD